MAATRPASADAKNGEGLKLLIIDDEADHAEAVAESLERIGYECVIATSGSAGAKKIDDEEPDVVLTDLKMDGVDGLTIVRKTRQTLPNTEVVVIKIGRESCR